MAVTLSDVKVGILFSGQRLVSGIGTMSADYVTPGDVLDLSSYILSTDSPHVVLSGGSGYKLEHNGGTAAAGVVSAYISDAGNVAAEAADNTNLAAITFRFIAVGDPLA